MRRLRRALFWINLIEWSALYSMWLLCPTPHPAATMTIPVPRLVWYCTDATHCTLTPLKGYPAVPPFYPGQTYCMDCGYAMVCYTTPIC